MTAKIIYRGELRTECTHVRSGTIIETDAPVDNHGKGERFSPTDLVATALGACIISTWGISKLTSHIHLTGATCSVEKVMVPNPRKIGEIKLIFDFPEIKQRFAEDEKKALEMVANTCPVIESLHPDCKKSITFNWPGE